MKKIFAIAAILALSLSCDKDDTLVYDAIETGNIVGGQFISDSGIKFTVKEKETSGDLSSVERAIILCDILSSKGDGSAEIRLKEFVKMHVLEPLMLSEIPSDREASTNPSELAAFWCSGPYFNFQMRYLTRQDSAADHRFDIIVDDTDYGDDSLRVRIEHFADGEYLGSPSFNTTGAGYAGRYLSIPSDFLPESQTTIPFRVTIVGNKTNADGSPDPATKINTFTGTLTR